MASLDYRDPVWEQTNKTSKILQSTKERCHFDLFAVGCSQVVWCVLSKHKPWGQSPTTRQRGTCLTNSVVPGFPWFLALPHSHLEVCISTSLNLVRDTSPQETGKFSPTFKEFFKLVLFDYRNSRSSYNC